MRVAETSPNRRESLTAALQAGDLHRNELDDVKGAEVCYYWAAERHKSAEAMARLAELLRAQGRHAALAQVLEQMLPMAEQARRLPVHLELGALYGGPLRAPVAARRHYLAAVEIDGTNEVALAALESLLERAGADGELARILEKRFQLRDTGEEGLRLLLKLAAVYGELKDDRASLRVAGLLHQRFAGDEKAAAVAEQIYGAHGRFSELCDLYAHRIEALEKEGGAESQVAELLVRKGNIELQRLSSTQQATESFARAVELCPGDMNALGLLERVLVNTGDWQRLKAVYELRANRLTSRAEQIASLHRAAKIAHNQLHDEAETTRYYERIHALDPSDAQSFAYLERRLEVKNDYRRLVELLVNRAARVASKQEGLTCILRAAAISEKIHDIDRALKLYRQGLSIDSNCQPALEAMARIYEALEQWDEFVKIIRWHIQVETSPANQAMLYFKLGSVMETQYQDDDEAVRNYTRAVSNSRTCLPALHSLRDLYSRRERWDKVVETLEREIPLWEDDKGRAEVLAQIAEIYANKLGDREKALGYYRRAVAAHKENMSAALALFEAHISQGDFAEAVAWGDIYARQVQIKGNKLQRAAFLVRWAGVLRHTGRYKEAAEHLVQVLDIRPEQQEALYELLELCREAPDAYDFASAFSTLLKDASKREDPLARALLLAGSGILAEHQNDIDAALDLYSRALEEGGERVQLARFKADLLVLVGREQEAVELIKRCSQASREAGLIEWIDGPLWLAEYHAVWRGDYDQAADLCGAILKELPDCLEARLQLARMEMLVGRPAEAQVQQLHICDQMAREQADARQLAERFHAVGLAALRAGNQQAAESSWRRACELAPDWPFPFVALARSRLAKGEPEMAEQQLLKAATAVGGDSPVLLRAQAAFYASRGQHGRALEFAQRAAELPTADLEDIVVLAHHLARHGEVGKSVATLREALVSDATYLPVIRELHEVWSASGQRQLARRAEQVLNVALGGANAEPGQLVRRPIGPASWTRLMADLAPHPLHLLWQTLGENLISRFEVAVPQTTPATPEYQLACRQLADVFDVHVRVMVAQQSGGALFRLLDDVLAVSPEAAPLGAAEARALVAMGMAAKKSGHAAFFGLPRSLRLDASRLLACLLVAENEWPVEARELVARLPRREQRQVQRLASQTKLETPVVDSTAQSWTVAAEAWCMRTALLVTEDLVSVARLLALQQDPSWMGEGSLFAALPEVPEIASYYLSESFQVLHQSLHGSGE
jgi:tetratricopeptide (TPR) repeat protein